MSTHAIDISGLSKEERLGLLEELWESFERRPEDLPLSGAQREELDRRVKSMEEDGSLGIPWEEVVQRIQSKAK